MVGEEPKGACVTPRALLIATRAYIEKENEKAKKLRESYALLSFAYCLEQAIDAKPGESELTERMRRLVWKTAESCALGRYDVFTPEEAFTLIELTLATLPDDPWCSA